MQDPEKAWPKGEWMNGLQSQMPFSLIGFVQLCRQIVDTPVVPVDIKDLMKLIMVFASPHVVGKFPVSPYSGKSFGSHGM